MKRVSVWCVLCILVAPAPSPAQRTATPSAMARLLEEFRTAKSPTPAEVLGRWVQVVSISTERYLTGGTGPDHIDSNSTGLRAGRENRELMWVMTLSRQPDGQVIGASVSTWLAPDTSIMRFPSDSGMKFFKETGGDSLNRYRCRALNDRLICVDDATDPGYAAVFRRIQ